MYRQFGWVDSPYYLALIVPTLFAQETYFVYMLIQFMRNIRVSWMRRQDRRMQHHADALVLVLVPMLWPAMVSAGLFQFMWSSNDFMGPLLYVNNPARYPATLFVRMSMDADTGFAWNRVMAVSLISIIRRWLCSSSRRAVHGRRDGRRRQGLISLLLFFGGCQANKNDILRAKLSIWARKVSKGDAPTGAVKRSEPFGGAMGQTPYLKMLRDIVFLKCLVFELCLTASFCYRMGRPDKGIIKIVPKRPCETKTTSEEKEHPTHGYTGRFIKRISNRARDHRQNCFADRRGQHHSRLSPDTARK